MHPAGSEIRETGLDLLADIDAIHEVIPRERGRKAAYEPDGLRPHAAAFRFYYRHGMKCGNAIANGKRPLSARLRLRRGGNRAA